MHAHHSEFVTGSSDYLSNCMCGGVTFLTLDTLESLEEVSIFSRHCCVAIHGLILLRCCSIEVG